MPLIENYYFKQENLREIVLSYPNNCVYFLLQIITLFSSVVKQVTDLYHFFNRREGKPEYRLMKCICPRDKEKTLNNTKMPMTTAASVHFYNKAFLQLKLSILNTKE